MHEFCISQGTNGETSRCKNMHVRYIKILSTKLIQSSVFSAWDSSSWSRHTLAVNTTLPAFAAERRAAGHPSLSIDILPTVRSAANPPITTAQSSDRTERWTDTRPLHRRCSAYYAGSVYDVQYH